jgi:hypothetical protein
MARANARKRRVAMLQAGMISGWMPERTLLCAVMIGFVCLAILSPVILAGFSIVGITTLSWRHFLIFKLAFATSEGALITPLIALLAISRSAKAKDGCDH